MRTSIVIWLILLLVDLPLFIYVFATGVSQNLVGVITAMAVMVSCFGILVKIKANEEARDRALASPPPTVVYPSKQRITQTSKQAKARAASYTTLPSGEKRCLNCGFVNSSNAQSCSNCNASWQAHGKDDTQIYTT